MLQKAVSTEEAEILFQEEFLAYLQENRRQMNENPHGLHHEEILGRRSAVFSEGKKRGLKQIRMEELVKEVASTFVARISPNAVEKFGKE